MMNYNFLKIKKTVCIISIACLFISCLQPKQQPVAPPPQDTIVAKDSTRAIDSPAIVNESASAATIAAAPKGDTIDTKNVKPAQLVSFAQTLLGTPYKYASSNVAEGFDCSGFITYVFNHFGISVPRSSIDFTNTPIAITETMARPGDLILFTGTDSSIKIVGHMGIILSNNSEGIRFIHSSSGKANGVTISPLEGYYRGRFVKLIRVFNED